MSDTLFLIIQLITLGLLESVNEYEFSKSIQFGRPITLPLRNFAYICSIYFIVLLTIERFIVICHQHKVAENFYLIFFNTKPQPQALHPQAFDPRLFKHELTNQLPGVETMDTFLCFDKDCSNYDKKPFLFNGFILNLHLVTICTFLTF